MSSPPTPLPGTPMPSRPSSRQRNNGHARDRSESAGCETEDMQLEGGQGGTLIVVANRLPVTITKDESVEGGYSFKASSGGLASALSGCKASLGFSWIGWPGFDVPEADRPFITQKLQDEYACTPVYLPAELAEQYYNGFSNSMLWPLFHYHPGEMTFVEADWLAYRQANLLFAEQVRQEVKSRDIVWVQDYHLCLVPLYLRDLLGRAPTSMGEAAQRDVAGMFDGLVLGSQAASPRIGSTAPAGVNGSHGKTYVPEVQIGFFLHTPFPSSEVFRTLPVRREVLLGMLNSDLIGFHTYDYARHFLSSVSRLLGLRCLPNSVELVGRSASVGTFPIGIEPQQFNEALIKDSVIARIAALKRRFEGVKIICGIDRLDYIKGVPQKLHALEAFLEEHPEWIGRVVLVQVAVPSRGDVEEYRNLRASVNELVGRINGRFGTVDFMPIHFIHKSVDFQELCALYAVSDACLISSTRDGMNLVAYEYIACQSSAHGVLILSEFAGAAHSLHGSLIVNPWNTSEMASAIHKGLTMPHDTREENYRKLWRYVSKFTSIRWGTSFVYELQQLRTQQQALAHEADKEHMSTRQRIQLLRTASKRP